MSAFIFYKPVLHTAVQRRNLPGSVVPEYGKRGCIRQRLQARFFQLTAAALCAACTDDLRSPRY